ncbi:MAG: amidohydrolase [Coriobacteriales bacterium]|jgi:amidohydrolase|nr:amidohydrolase [Coriobacteriales bacterium]
MESLRIYEQHGLELRHWFHAHPEPSFKEFGTAGRIREELERLHIPYVAVGATGTVATVVGIAQNQDAIQPERVVALRADIDALEISEDSGLSWCSVNPGLMHACGHDIHITALLIAAHWLIEHRSAFSGSVKLIFQAAEEIGQGAAQIIQSGAIDGVDVVFGLHVEPALPVGTIVLPRGPVMAGSNALRIHVIGEGGHGGKPHEARDALLAAAAIVVNLQQVVTRATSAVEPAVLSICQFNAGTRGNIIANTAELIGTIRVSRENQRAVVEEAVRRIIRGTATAYDVDAEVEYFYATPPIVNPPHLMSLALRAHEALLPGGALIEEWPQMTTEDFGRYGEVAATFYALVGVHGEPFKPLHNAGFSALDESILIAAGLHVAFALEALKEA